MFCSSLACLLIFFSLFLWRPCRVACPSSVLKLILSVCLHLCVSQSDWTKTTINQISFPFVCECGIACRSVKPIFLLKSAVTTVLLLIRSLGHQHWDLLSCLDYSVDDFYFQGLSRDFKVQVLEFSQMFAQKRVLQIKMRQSLSDIVRQCFIPF